MAMKIIRRVWFLAACAAVLTAVHNLDLGGCVRADDAEVCSAVNARGDPCNIQNNCARCIRTTGCVFDVMVRGCVPAPKDKPLYEASTNPLLNRSRIEYCADDDAVCAACRVTSAQPLCEGVGDCICPSVCNLMRPVQMSCYQQKQAAMVYISIAVAAIALPVLLWAQRKCMGRGRSSEDSLAGMHAMRVRNMQARQARQGGRNARPPSALALQLESWRSHRDETKVDVENLELKHACYVLMDPEPPLTQQQQPQQQQPRSRESDVEPHVEPSRAHPSRHASDDDETKSDHYAEADAVAVDAAVASSSPTTQHGASS